MFWCWFDVLILGVNFDFDPVQISALFSVSFWIALVMKVPGAALAKRLGAGRSILLSAFMFLAAALLLTFGRTLPRRVIGQSIYLDGNRIPGNVKRHSEETRPEETLFTSIICTSWRRREAYTP